jgi:hypothetical protein
MNLNSEISSAATEQTRSERPHFLQQTTFTILHDFPEPEIELVWRALLGRVALPSHYTSPEFFREPYFDGKRPFAILALHGRLATAVMVGVHEAGTVTCGLPTRPQIQIDPAGDIVAALDALMRGLEVESRGSELVSFYSWEGDLPSCMGAYGYRSRILEGVPVLDLSQGPDSLLKKLDGKRRNCIRYAIRNNVEVSPASTPEDYEAFYNIYKDWCAAKHMPCYSRTIEELAFHNTENNRRLFLARHSGVVVAGSVFRFFSGGLIEYSRNSSLPAYLHLKPNDILVWRAIEWACREGFVSFSMGGAHRFLREFGGSTIPIHRYRMDRSFLCRHDRKEALLDFGRTYLHKLPPDTERTVRRILHKERAAGW